MTDVLVCPASVDSEAKEIEYFDDREKYIALANGLLDFWDSNVDFLNDLKHGFWPLPFDLDTFESLPSPN